MKYRVLIVVSLLLTSCTSTPTPVLDLGAHGKGAYDYWKAAYREPPVYPRKALRKGITGCVLLRHVTSSLGKSRNVEVLYSVPSDIFDYSAKQALRKYRWVTTSKNRGRKPVRSDWVLNFTTTDNPQAPSCVQPKT